MISGKASSQERRALWKEPPHPIGFLPTLLLRLLLLALAALGRLFEETAGLELLEHALTDQFPLEDTHRLFEILIN